MPDEVLDHQVDDHADCEHHTNQCRNAYKLCDELIKRFCENLRTNPGIPVEAICDSVGIARQTFYAWLDQGKKEPGGLHAKFAQEVTKALGDSWKLLHEMAIKAKPEQILFRRYANFYPAQRLEADLTSAGMPFLPQTFSVVLELNGPADEQEFEVQHNGDVG